MFLLQIIDVAYFPNMVAGMYHVTESMFVPKFQQHQHKSINYSEATSEL